MNPISFCAKISGIGILSLFAAASLSAAIGDNSPPIPATYKTSHPRLPAPDSTFLTALANNPTALARYNAAADGWDSRNPGNAAYLRRLVIAYMANKIANPTKAAIYLTKIQALADLGGTWSSLLYGVNDGVGNGTYTVTSPTANFLTGCNGGSCVGYVLSIESRTYNVTSIPNANTLVVNASNPAPTGSNLKLRLFSGSGSAAIYISLVYDWLYNDLDAPTKSEFLLQLEALCAEWEEYYVGLGASPYNDVFYIRMDPGGMIAALAIYPDHPNGATHLKFMMDVWFNMLMPVWKQSFGPEGGGWHESWEYVNSSSGGGLTTFVVPSLLSWQAASGDPIFARESWLKNFGYFTMYMTRPDNLMDSIGDTSRGYLQGEYDIQIGAKLGSLNGLAEIYNDPLIRGWARYLNDEAAGGPDGFEPSAWPFYTPDKNSNAVSTRAAAAPTVRNFTGWGLLSMRSGWSEDDTAVTLKYGDNLWSHEHFDTGAFTIFSRGNLALDSGTYRAGSASKHQIQYGHQTIAHNTLTITDPADYYPATLFGISDENGNGIALPAPNDGGQRRVGSGINADFPQFASPNGLGDWFRNWDYYHMGKMVAFSPNQSYTYSAVDITNAYNNKFSATTPNATNRTYRVQKAVRHMLFIPRGTSAYVVVFDQVVSTNASFVKKWLLHTINQPTVTGSRFEVLRNELVTELPYVWTQNSGQKYATSDNHYQYNGKLYGWMVQPQAGSINLVGGPGKEFWIEDPQNPGTGSNWNQCMQGQCDANIEGLGPVQDLIQPYPATAPHEPGSWRIEEKPGAASTQDMFLNVMLATNAGDTNVPANVTVPAGLAAGMVGATWTEGGKTYTITFPQNGVGGHITITSVVDEDLLSHAQQLPDQVQVVSGGQQAGSANSALPSPLVVAVKDNAGNPVPNAAVHFAITQGNGRLSPDMVYSDSQGHASTTLTLGAGAANSLVTVTALVSGVNPPAFVETIGTTPSAATVSSLSCSPSLLAANTTTTCSVTLSQAAPGGGATVNLASSTPTLTVPAAVSIPAGFSNASFTATAGSVSAVAPVLTGDAASFLRVDTTALGSWKGVYGNDGYNILGDTANYPSYVQVTPSGNSAYTWASSTAAPGALLKAASSTDRIASGWYSNTSFTIDVAFQDQNTHQFALYFQDYDYQGRNERVDLLDKNNTVLDSRTVSNFGAGQYLVWNVSGHVIVRITNLNTVNAIVNGIFFDPVSASQSAVITGTYNTGTTNTFLTLLPSSGSPAATPSLTSVTCTPSTLTPGGTATCTVTMSQPVATGGATVTLSSNLAALAVPAAVIVPAGSSTATFTATAGSVSAGQTAVVTATYGSISLTSNFTFAAATPSLTSVACTPSTIVALGSSSCTVTLSQAAGASGVTVTLASNSTALAVPGSVSAPAGSTTAGFTATAGAISTGVTAVVTATYNGNSQTVSLALVSGSGGGIPLPNKTWVMAPAQGFPVQIVGYDKLVYAPSPVKKAVILDNYHELGSEPNQSFIAYDFDANRWDVLNIGGSFHTEDMPDAGHTAGSISYDPNRKSLIYYCCFSGSNQPENVLYTWWFDPIGQVGRSKPTSPKPGQAMQAVSAFDAAHDTFVLFGGGAGTWTYSPATNAYTAQTPNGTVPTDVGLGSMLYNSNDHKIYLFGGSDGTTYYNDIFTYDVPTNTWAKLNPSGPKPPGRYQAGFAYDSTNNVFLLYGGENAAGVFGDTWVYDPAANAWSQLSPGQSPPLMSAGPFDRLVYDSDHNAFILVYNGVWVFRYAGAGSNPGTVTPAYTPTPGKVNRYADAWAKEPTLAVSGSSLYAAWDETGQPNDSTSGAFFHIYASQLGASGWSALGGLPASLDSEFNNYSESHSPSMAIVGGTPWISWYKWNNSGSAQWTLWAKSWTGSAWQGGPVGYGGTNDSAHLFQSRSQIADIGGVPHIAFLEVDKNAYPQNTFVHVKYWNGTQWTVKGAGALNINSTATTASSVSIASDGANPYVAWTEYGFTGYSAQTNALVYVARWTGSAWVQVGSALNVSSTNGWADDASIAILGGQPYVAWTEKAGPGGLAQVFVKTFSGGAWNLVGSGTLNRDVTSGWALRPAIAADAAGNSLYVAWVEQQSLGQRAQAYVSKYSAGAWTALGGSLNADPVLGSSQRVSLAVLGGQPVAAWGEVNSGSLRQVFTKQWNGSAWAAPAGGPLQTSFSACDLNHDGAVNALDVTLAINQALGTSPCSSADLMQTGQCNVIDVQRVIAASLGGTCRVGQ